MSDLIERIKELEEKEQLLSSIQNKVIQDIGRFIQAWDSNDPDQLPKNRDAMINDVRAVFEYVIARSDNDA
ncbi:hypothetical protein [Klebsiella michiganensis]|uniref:hypothetical protein n=1 Tax=Klebsiella michiganensis TaxID=1134687 RepID=UPI003F4F67AB